MRASESEASPRQSLDSPGDSPRRRGKSVASSEPTKEGKAQTNESASSVVRAMERLLGDRSK